ncbi:linolenate hydroperoxide lyase chloroplastic [Phtheirospermum japonicum]|uniref:Linolenate hydroperoxide lyase chloroplastic n=1 Tax=Phtheirospermum japonicum TaxID=374723 RepID=A0A830B3N3_9LAMI|nr:linolenate hydroperoxide lyase chloroplastic [Phtheirospermum japonicum]
MSYIFQPTKLNTINLTGGRYKMMMTSSMASATPLSSSSAGQRAEIPGGYGWPVIGPLSDRLQYFWFQGPRKFFEKRVEKYESTVFRTNVPPAFPFFAGVNPNVVAVLDVRSFAHLFDMELVEKANVLVGDFMPSLSFTGGLRVCAYLDTSETKHTQIKNFALDILKRSSSKWVPSMITSLDTMWGAIDSQLATSGSVGTLSYFIPLQQFLFSFLSRCLLGADPSADPEIKKSGHIMLDKWLALQLLPTISITALQPLPEIFFHSFSYPFWLVKSDYKKLAGFVQTEARETVQRAQTEFGLTEEEAIHNLLFTLGFNAFGGFSIFFPTLISNLGDQKSVHDELRKEVRQKLSGSKGLSFETVREMDLINSFVYETLRLSPPVPSQFGRARKDFDLSSHEAVYEIKKGELLCGYQPVVMRDPKIFENPEEFVYDRFSEKKGGRELLKYLFWSNGPQSGSQGPSASNKQCAAMDTVPMTAAVFLAYLFQRYDEIDISSGSINALVKAK